MTSSAELASSRWGAAAAAVALSLAAHAAMGAAFYAGGRSKRAPAPDPAPQLAGETFELPAPPTEAVPLANASPSTDQEGEEGAPSAGDGLAHTTAPPKAHRSPRASHARRPSGGRSATGDPEGVAGSTGGASLYGAVGDRSAADVATAFTRGFPQAASADPVWRAAPLGAAGEADVTITIDEDGHFVGADVGGAPSAPLAAGIRRTLALVKGRAFVARGKKTRLHVTATVSADAVHDGLHGDVFAIGGSFAGGEGSAFFALAVGRRIDLRVRLR